MAIDGDNNLEIVISARDEASATIGVVGEKVALTQNQIMDASIQAAMGMDQYGNSVQKVAAAESQAIPATEQMTAALAENTVVTEENNAATSAFSNSIEKAGKHFVVHALSIGLMIEAYTFLKESVEEAEKANNNFAEAMKKDDEASKAFKVSIGEALSPAIITFRDAITGANESTNESSQKFKEFGRVAYEVTNFVLAVAKSIQLFATVVVAGVEIAVDAWKNMGATVMGTNKDVNFDIIATKNVFNDSVDDINNTISKAGGGGFDKMFEKFSTGAGAPDKKLESLKERLDNVRQSLTTYATKAAEDLTNLQTSHDSYVANTSEKMKSLQTTFEETYNKEYEKIKQLGDSYVNASASITRSIDTIKGNIAQLKETFANQQTDNVDTLVQAFAKAQEEVNRLQEKLPNETSASQLVSDQKDLEANKKVLADNADLAAKYSKQIADAVAEDNKTGLQRAIDTFNKKQQREEDAYNDKLLKYQGEIAAENQKQAVLTANYNLQLNQVKTATTAALTKIQNEIDKYGQQMQAEQALFDAKTKAIVKLQAEAEKAIQEANAKTFALTKSNVQAEIDLYKQLATAMSQVGAAKSSGAISALPNIPHLAEGGIVNSPTMALIGESGPEAVIPLGGSAGGAGGVHVSVNVYGDVSGDDLVTKVGEKLTAMLKMNFALV